jgi:hypothetical protein
LVANIGHVEYKFKSENHRKQHFVPKKNLFSKKAKFIIFPSNGFWQKAAFAKRVNIDRSEKMKSMTG